MSSRIALASFVGASLVPLWGLAEDGAAEWGSGPIEWSALATQQEETAESPPSKPDETSMSFTLEEAEKALAPQGTSAKAQPVFYGRWTVDWLDRLMVKRLKRQVGGRTFDRFLEHRIGYVRKYAQRLRKRSPEQQEADTLEGKGLLVSTQGLENALRNAIVDFSVRAMRTGAQLNGTGFDPNNAKGVLETAKALKSLDALLVSSISSRDKTFSTPCSVDNANKGIATLASWTSLSQGTQRERKEMDQLGQLYNALNSPAATADVATLRSRVESNAVDPQVGKNWSSALARSFNAVRDLTYAYLDERRVDHEVHARAVSKLLKSATGCNDVKRDPQAVSAAQKNLPAGSTASRIEPAFGNGAAPAKTEVGS